CEAGAAPHLPTGIFSPLNGEKGPSSRLSPIVSLAERAGVAASLFLPVLRGEMPGRAMRGSADAEKVHSN
ncbi:MAG: hypothetical protein EOS76_21195, partial [Mesorhizobium sp.]